MEGIETSDKRNVKEAPRSNTNDMAENDDSDGSSDSSRDQINATAAIPVAAAGTKPGNVKVRKQAQYIDNAGDLVFEQELEVPPSRDQWFEKSDTVEPENRNALILVINLRTNQTKKSYRSVDGIPPTVQRVLCESLIINSKAILGALQSVVTYYPSEELGVTAKEILEPYQLIVHHLPELREYRDDRAPGGRYADELCKNQSDVYEDLGLLLDFIDEKMAESIAIGRERHKRGMTTFAMLWLLLKPGTDVYSDALIQDHGIWNKYVVQSVTGGYRLGHNESYTIKLWYMNFNGYRFGRSAFSVSILPFDGEKEISSLQVVPCEFFKDVDKDGNPAEVPIEERLEKRGRYFAQMANIQCVYYDGLTRSWPKRKYKGNMIIDMDEYLNFQKNSGPEIFMAPETGSVGVTDCACPVCVRRQKSTPNKARYTEYENIAREKKDELTIHQYTLFTARIFGFYCKTRTWQDIYIDNCTPPQYDQKLIERLVVPDERRKVIMHLSKMFVRQDIQDCSLPMLPWNANAIPGRGGGLIVLLHGKPGIGKTHTAECVAEYTRRPLLSISCSDIGTNPVTIEQSLAKWFKLGRQWGAIMLLDEADVYMERRVSQDLERNALVAGFLRALENYDGLLFLTTNRVGAFDDAFISRIHLHIYYPDFTDEYRLRVWQGFFDKLIRERETTMKVPFDTRDYVTEPEVTGLKWNGREIGNAIQTAVILAETEGDKDESGRVLLKRNHLKQIVQMSREFKAYIDELHEGDEAKRAERDRHRIDFFGGKGGKFV